jgi:hypothetical protein
MGEIGSATEQGDGRWWCIVRRRRWRWGEREGSVVDALCDPVWISEGPRAFPQGVTLGIEPTR